MSTALNYKSFFRENDEEPPKEYWGEKAAGCIFLAKDTGRILLAHRSDQVDYEPHTWGTWGGKIDGDESPAQAVKREVEEETGLDTPFKIHPLYIFRDGNFSYHNYLVIVPFEFTPKLNWENDGSEWVEYGQWPDPLHFGMEELIKHSGHQIKRVVDVLLRKKSTLFKEGATDSEGFSHWFGNSVVKDSHGKPLVVYHGTNQSIKSFSKLRRGMATKAESAKQAYFFTDSSEVANEYARNAGKTMRSDISTYEKKTKQFQKKLDALEKYARITGKWEQFEKAQEEFEKFDLDTLRNGDIIGQNVVPVFLKMENPLVYDYQGNSGVIQGITDLIATAKKNGNDGVILKNINDPLPVSNHYAVFKPTQIKSAIGNNGEYNKKHSDITKEAMDAPPQSPPAIVQKSPSQSSVSGLDSSKMSNAYIVIATIWGESRGEGEQGMQAVLNVIMNRSHNNFNKATEISTQHLHKSTHYQFSIWNGESNISQKASDIATFQRKVTNLVTHQKEYIQQLKNLRGLKDESSIEKIKVLKEKLQLISKNLLDNKMYNAAIKLVDQAMQNSLPDITDGATVYFNPKTANADFVERVKKLMVKTTSIGHHDFYKTPTRVTKAQQVNEGSETFSLEKQGIIDDGIYGYELKSPTSHLRYGYEPSRRVFYLYTIATPSELDQNKGYAKALLEHLFQIIKQANGALDVGPFTTSGTAYIKHVVERLANEYKVRLL